MKRVLNSLNIIIVLVPVLVLIGWQFNVEILKRPIPASVVMNPVTALCILFSGLSFYILTHLQFSERAKAIAFVLNMVVLTTGLLKLVSVFTGVELGADTYLYTQRVLADRSHNTPNSMAPNTALGLVLYTVSLFLFATNYIRARKTANYLSVLVLLIGLFSIIGYLYHVKAYYGLLTFYPMAVHTGICLALMSLAMLLYNNKVGFMVVLSNPNIAGQVGRLLIPATIVIPIALGFIRLYLQWNFPISVELGVSLLIVSVIVVVFALTWYVTVTLNKADVLRVAAEEELLKKNERLREAEERLLLATEGRTAGIWDWIDINAAAQIWSPQFYALLGYDENEIPSTADTLRPLMHPEDTEPFRQLLQAHFAGKGKFELEHRIKTKDGTYKWFLNTGQAKFNDAGQPIRFVGSIVDIDEKKKVEKALLEQSALTQIIPDAIIVMDTELVITSWNKGAETLYELKASEAIGKSLYDIANVGTSASTRAERLQILKAGGVVRNEVPLVTLSGKKTTILATTKLVTDNQGKITGTVAIHTDITSLKINEERLQLATEGTSAGLWDWIDMSGDAEWWSSRFYELLGYNNNEIPASAKTFREIMHPDDFEKIAKSLNAHFKDRSRFEIEARLKTKSGVYKWFLGTGLVSRNESGTPIRMVGSIIDIDEQKKTRDFTEQQAALINMLPDGIVFYLTGLKVADINAGAEKMFDLKRDEVLGKSIDDFISFSLSSGEKFEEALLRLRQTGFYRGELDIVNKHSGKKVQVLVSIKKMENAYASEPLFMAIYTDLTPLRVNEELKQALKTVETNNQYLEQFAYISAHDIKAPIITIAGLAELMDNSHAVKTEHVGILKMLRNSVQQIQRTNHSLNNILKLRKNLLAKENTNDQSVELQTILNDVKAGLQSDIETAGAIVEANLNGLEETNFNYVYTKSILYNLLSNSIKYRDPQRQLTVKITALKTEQDKLRFIVEDNGLGFDTARNKKKMFGIFKRFHTHVDGAGIGLHIVKSIIDDYNGNIEVYSEPGKGAKFVIDFNKNILA